MPYCRARHSSPLRSFWRHDGAIKVSRKGLGNRRRMQYSVVDEGSKQGRAAKKGEARIQFASQAIRNGKDRDKVVRFGEMTFPFALSQSRLLHGFRSSNMKRASSVLRLARSLSASSRREDSCSRGRVSRFPLPSQIELNLNDTSSLSSSASSLVSCAVSRRLAVKSFLLFALMSGVHGLD